MSKIAGKIATKPQNRCLFAFILGFGAVTGAAYAAGLDWSPYGNESKRTEAVQKANDVERRAKTAEQEAAAAKKRAAELEQRLKVAEEKAQAAERAKVAGNASSTADTARTPLRVFRDKLKGGGEGPAMVVIPVGDFNMGSNDSDASSDEKHVHRVSIKKAFAIGKTEVTQREWRQVMGSDPAELRFNGCDDCPVENVSWNDAQSYIKKLNEQTGKTTYRLPSEAEWEYACRGGKANDKYCGGNDVDALAWYDKNSSSKTRPVAQKQANAYGLYDMSGNVNEWVEDWYYGSYTGAPQDGSAWVTGGGQTNRVLRGGSWYGIPEYVRTAYRYYSLPSHRNSNFGFRVARTLP